MRSSPLALRPILLSRLEFPLVIGGYLLLAVVMSYPLVTQFSDHIPGVDGDVWSYLWAMGWARLALLDLGVNPFHSDYIFYPLGGATQLLWGTALPSLASIPLQLACGLVSAFNLAYLAATTLTGLGMYLLGKEVLREEETGGKCQASSAKRQASFVVGLVFAFGALRLGYGLAFTNLFHTEFMPFYVLYLLRATRTRARKAALLAGFFFALNVYIDFQIAAFLALLTALWFLYVLIEPVWTQRRRVWQMALEMRLLARWTVLGVSAGALCLPMLVLVLWDFQIEGGNYIRVYPLVYSMRRSYDALSFVLPNARSTLYQNVPLLRVPGVNVFPNEAGDAELSPDRQVFLGLTVLGLALIGVSKRPRALWFWIVMTLLFAILSLGPVLHLAGQQTTLALPFSWLQQVPLLNHIRIPMRYGLMVLMGAAVLAGAGAYMVVRGREALFAPLGLLIVLESAMLPYPTLALRVPRVYEQIARTPGDFTVLEIPSFNWRHAAKNEAYQPFHRKRILRAYTNRIAPEVADYFSLRQTPIVVRSLRILEGAEEGTLTADELQQDQAALDAVLRFFHLRYAVLHRDQLPPERAAQIAHYLTAVLGARAIYDDGVIAAYEWTSAAENEAESAPASVAFDLADNSNLMYLGRGWQIEPLAQIQGERGRYLQGGRTEFYFHLAAPRALELRWRTLASLPVLYVTLNGTEIGLSNHLPNGSPGQSVVLSPHLLRVGMNRLEWRYASQGDTGSAISIVELRGLAQK